MTDDLLKRLDYQHRTLVLALGKEGPTLYSEAAAEIRRLVALSEGIAAHRTAKFIND